MEDSLLIQSSSTGQGQSKKNRQYSYGQHKTIITIKGQSKTVCYESEEHFVKVYKVVVKLYKMCTMRFQLIFGLKFICLFFGFIPYLFPFY